MRTLANLLDWSPTAYWRFENATDGQSTIADVAEVAALLGFETALTFHPAGPPLRDKGHEALLGRLTRRLSPGWHVTREAPFPNSGDPRSWDVLLRCGDYRVGVEAETRIRDMQALVRRMRERSREGGVDQMVLTLSDSAVNRRMAGDLRTALAPDFATPPRASLAALQAARPLPSSAVVLL